MKFIWPLDDPVITRNFYYKSSLYISGQHAALDLIPRIGTAAGTPIKVVASGVGVGSGWDFYSGYFFAADHEGGFRTFYRHLWGPSPIAVGQRVTQGQVIGNMGNTGWSLGNHLHFDLWNRNKIRDDNAIFYKNGWYALDPVFYLGQETKQEDDDMGIQFGLPGDIPVPGNYGGGRTKMAVWRPETGEWLIEGQRTVQLGLPSDIPVPGDYNGDGKTQRAVWRPSNGKWYIQ